MVGATRVSFRQALAYYMVMPQMPGSRLQLVAAVPHAAMLNTAVPYTAMLELGGSRGTFNRMQTNELTCGMLLNSCRACTAASMGTTAVDGHFSC